RQLADQPISSADIKKWTGTFVLNAGKLPENLHDSYAQFRRTYRVFDENGRLMIQPLGSGAERLLKQDDGTFAMRSAPRTHVTFARSGAHASGMRMESLGGLPRAGDRVGAGDPATFHAQLR